MRNLKRSSAGIAESDGGPHNDRHCTSTVDRTARRSDYCFGRRPDQRIRDARGPCRPSRPLLETLQPSVSGRELMIYSMTGFGSARAESGGLAVLVEIKSVNHRYLDLHIKIPAEFQTFENVIRQKVTGQFKRGRLDAFVRIDFKRENIKLDV